MNPAGHGLQGRLGRRSLMLAAAGWLAGCAAPPKPSAPQDNFWSGRLALSVAPPQAQSFSAGFELRGGPQAGELTLTHPLGGIAAVLTWAPGRATLRSGQDLRQFPSLEALAEEATGAPLPIAALFDWLRGVAAPVAGWSADLSQLADGRLLARRTEPPPLAELRLLLER